VNSHSTALGQRKVPALEETQGRGGTQEPLLYRRGYTQQGPCRSSLTATFIAKHDEQNAPRYR
jgi:hypothetical protein